jgi:NAD(P)-dependent dehydrogenase (short-subunit alcohol dehydrogenase family)
VNVLVIGASGTIGAAVADVFATKHTVLRASRSRSPLQVDLGNADSIRALFEQIGQVDLVLSAAGQAALAPLAQLTDADYALSISNKLMGQVNLVRIATDYVNAKGAFVLCGGVVSRTPIVGGAALSIVNAGLEGFARAAALELPRGIRINVVAPGWVRETLIARNMDPRIGASAAAVAQAYVTAAATSKSGQVFDV